MASCTISPGQEVTDIYSQCYYDQARADRAAKCAEYRSGIQYRVCRVIITGCSMLQVPVLLPGVRGPLAAAALLAGVAAGHAAVQPHGQCAQVTALCGVIVLIRAANEGPHEG